MAKYHHVEDFFDAQLPEFQDLLYLIRETIVNTDPHMHETLKYNTAFYVRKSWLCYIGIIRKKIGVEVCFARGYDISNEHGLLLAKGRAAMRGITFRDVSDFEQKADVFMEILQEAILLDDLRKRSAAADILGAKAHRTPP